MRRRLVSTLGTYATPAQKARKVLTETLRGMTTDGLVAREAAQASASQHVEYRLTELGLTLREPPTAICSWATDHPAGLPAGD